MKTWIKKYNISQDIYKEVIEKDCELKDIFTKLNEIEEFNTLKVLDAMQSVELAATDFYSPTGYGYGDVGREKVEKIYSKIFKTEDALVRPNIASGTHALALTLQGVLKYGNHLLSITGTPYDTMQQVIGITGNEPLSLKEMGISYSEVPLEDKININEVLKEIKPETKVILIQRSTGYSLRPAISLEDMEFAISKIKELHPDIIIMVDNCYGEFTQRKEPTEIGADICVGSLIKNIGGGIAISGGYIVSTKDIIHRISNRLTAPGLGKEVGLTYNTTRTTLQGLFLAPKITSEALKSALLFSYVFTSRGYETIPSVNEKRYDIIQAIVLKDPKKVVAFCEGIQKVSAVDSHVTPVPWPMPGYENDIIMASGSFIDGSSIEISADGPLRDPFCVYYQGGLSYYQSKLACMVVLEKLRQMEN